MSYTWSLIAFTPAAFKETAEALGAAMGHGGNEFNVAWPGPDSPTHYYLATFVTPETAAVWLGNAYPADTGFTHEQIDAVRSQLIISCIEGANPLTHFELVLIENSLDRSGE